MRSSAFLQHLQQQIDDVKAEGLYKAERIITSQQQIDKASVYQGVLQVLLLFKPYATEQAKPRITRLQQHYEALAY